MKYYPIIAIICVSLAACELIRIGGATQQESIDISQKTPVGVIYLFKAELDSNNIPAATQIIANPNGTKLLAYEKYELYDDLERIGRIISKKPVTKVRTDSVNTSMYKVSMEFDYQKTMHFTTSRIKELWYITSYSE
jgi:predicted amidohydrolase